MTTRRANWNPENESERESRLRLQKLHRLAQEFLAEVHNVANGECRLTIPIRQSTHQNATVRFLSSSGVTHSPKEALAGRNLHLIAGHNVLYVRLSERPSVPRSRDRTRHFCAFAWLSPLVLAGPLPVVNCGDSVRVFPSTINRLTCTA